MRNQFRRYGFLRRGLVPVVLALVVVSPSFANARDYDPYIMYVFPAGAQRGTTVEGIMARGRGLEGTSEVRISGEGVTAKVVAIEEPSTRLQQRSANRQDQAENPNVVKFSVTIAPDAPLGERDLWLITPKGATNRFHFIVGQVPEVNEADEDSEEGEPQLLESLPILVNGQYNQGDHDVFRFAAQAGQTLVCEVQGQKLVPYIADAVPGWFQPCLTLYDSTGKELQYADDFRFHPDPLLVYNVEQDGEYLIEVKDALFRGREDLIYRLSIGALPYITHIYPLGGQRASDAQVELHGVNLAAANMNLTLPADSLPLRHVQVTANGLTSNALRFVVGDTPEAAEAEPNDAPDQANKVQVPATVNGRIQQDGDADHFTFSARKGQRLVMDVRARRLDSPLDSIITLFTASGQQLAENDDTEDLSEGLITHHADSYLNYTFQADGDYVLRLADIQARGGEEYAYRLTIAPPRPDFHLRLVPANLSVAQGATALAKIKAYRRDGFGDEISVAVEGLPPGFLTSPAAIPPGQNEARFTITAPPDAAIALLSPTVSGTATITDEAVQAEKKAAGEVLAKVKAELAKANADFDAAEKAAGEAETAAAQAKTAGATAAAAHAAAQKTAATQRQQADEAKKKVEDLVANQQKPAQAKLAADTKAVTDAAAAKAAADTSLAEAKAATAKAQQAAEAAEKAAVEAEALAKTIAEDAGKSEEEKKQAAADAAAKRKAADEAKTALTAAQQNEQQPQTLADTAAQKLAEAETQKKSAEEALTNVNRQVTAATEASQAAEKAAQGAETAAASAKAEADKAAAAHTPLEKAAPEKRKLANEAKAKRDKLVADEQAANTRLAEANKKPDAATVERQALPAEELMQAFYYWHDVPTKELLLAVVKSTYFALSTDSPPTEVHEVSQGGELSVVVKVAREGLQVVVAQAEAEKKAAEEALAKVKADLEQAKTDYAAAQKAANEAPAAEQADARAKAAAAKATQDKLVADEKAANAKLAEANQNVEAAQQAAKGAISLKADTPPRGITVKTANIPADQNEATITMTVTKQAPVDVTQNIIITGSVRAGKDTITRVAPAIPIRVVAAPK